MAGKGTAGVTNKKTAKSNGASRIRTGDIASFFGGKPLPAKKSDNSTSSKLTSAVESVANGEAASCEGSGSNREKPVASTLGREKLPCGGDEAPAGAAGNAKSELVDTAPERASDCIADVEVLSEPTGKVSSPAADDNPVASGADDDDAVEVKRRGTKRRVVVEEDESDGSESEVPPVEPGGGVRSGSDSMDSGRGKRRKNNAPATKKSVADVVGEGCETGKLNAVNQASSAARSGRSEKRVTGSVGKKEEKQPTEAVEVDDSEDVDSDSADEQSDDEVDARSKQNPTDVGRAKLTSSGGTGAKRKDEGRGRSAGSYSLTGEPDWPKGKPVPYRFLADAFDKVEHIQGRLEIQAILTDVFRKIIDTTPEDLLPAIYLCMNKLSAAHEGIESGVGEFILLKALSKTSGSTIPVLKARYKETGDLGDVAAGARATQTTMFPPPPLKVRTVFTEMRNIAMASGKASTDAKMGKILKLLVASQSKNETRYLARAMQGKLRIHLAVKTVVTSLANAVTLRRLGAETGFLLDVEGKKKTKLSEKETKIEEQLKEAANRLSAIYNQLPVWEKIIPPLLKHAEISEGLASDCKFTPGIPVSPMLAKPTKEITEVLTRFSDVKFTCEYKYDGERAQVHRLADGTVKVYSRNAEDLTSKYPDIVKSIPEALKSDLKGASFVLDAETVAYDVEKKKILPFQELQGRKRKDVDAKDVTVKVCLFAFDLLYFDGKSLLLEPLSARREVMRESFEEVQGVFFFAEGHDSKDTEEIMELLNESIKAGCEGLMVKALDGENATYEPANRSQNWLKVKKDYLDGVGDTLDLVPIGGYLGKGKRLGTYGGFLLACFDRENEVFQSICKIGTGFSDSDLETISAYFNDEAETRKLDAPKSYYQVSDNKNLQPDVWFETCQVWEVLCADLSISPLHKAAMGHIDPSKGIALRFPRFVRIREDKGPEDATDSEQVAELYSAQSSIANKA